MTTALEGVRGQRHAPAALYPGENPVPIVQEAGWAAGPILTGEEYLASTGIRFPDRPARSQSLYRLRYPAQSITRALRKFGQHMLVTIYLEIPLEQALHFRELY